MGERGRSRASHRPSHAMHPAAVLRGHAHTVHSLAFVEGDDAGALLLASG